MSWNRGGVRFGNRRFAKQRVLMFWTTTLISLYLHAFCLASKIPIETPLRVFGGWGGVTSSYRNGHLRLPWSPLPLHGLAGSVRGVGSREGECCLLCAGLAWSFGSSQTLPPLQRPALALPEPLSGSSVFGSRSPASGSPWLGEHLRPLRLRSCPARPWALPLGAPPPIKAPVGWPPRPWRFPRLLGLLASQGQSRTRSYDGWISMGAPAGHSRVRRVRGAKTH